MQKKFIQNLLFLLFLNLLIKPFWILGIDRSVQNIVGNQEYGFYWALFNFSFIFQIIIDFGINSFNNRNIAQHQQLLGKYFSSIIVLKLLLTVLYIIILFSIGFIIGYSPRAFRFLVFLAFNQILASYILYLRSNISALQYFKTDSVFSVMDRAFMIIMCSIVLWTKFISSPFQIEWFVYIQTISLSTTAILAFIFVYHKAAFFRPRFDKAFFFSIIKSSYPFAILTLLMSLYTRIDGVMIERLLPDPLGKVEAGIYASGYRILDAANMISFLFATLLLPIFSRMLKEKQDIRELAGTSFSLFIFPALILVFGCFFYRSELMSFLYHKTDPYPAKIFGLLIFNYLSIGSIYIFGTLLTANANLRFLNIISLLGMIVNIILNFFLIRHFRAFGAVMATLFTQLLVSGLQVYMAVELFNIKIGVKTIVRSVIFIITMLGSFYFLKGHLMGWKYEMLILSVTGLLLAFLLKLINIRNMVKIVFS